MEELLFCAGGFLDKKAETINFIKLHNANFKYLIGYRFCVTYTKLNLESAIDFHLKMMQIDKTSLKCLNPKLAKKFTFKVLYQKFNITDHHN